MTTSVKSAGFSSFVHEGGTVQRGCRMAIRRLFELLRLLGGVGVGESYRDEIGSTPHGESGFSSAEITSKLNFDVLNSLDVEL